MVCGHKLRHKKQLHLTQWQHSVYSWCTSVEHVLYQCIIHHCISQVSWSFALLIDTYISMICWQIIDCQSKAIFFPRGTSIIIIPRAELATFKTVWMTFSLLWTHCLKQVNLCQIFIKQILSKFVLKRLILNSMKGIKGRTSIDGETPTFLCLQHHNNRNCKICTEHVIH
jgi:hypothetical protein